jgi:ech hydrogenase subunit E
MATRTVIPFGPQHPVLPEPLHLDLVVEDETVVEAVPSIGFIHRGLEKLVERSDFTEFTHIAERICGICSFIHGLTYCQGIERLMQVEVPGRALYLRTIWSELSRVHSHLLWLGLMADAMGFESLFMHLWRLRERILDIIEETAGGRVIFGAIKIGGVRKEVSDAKLQEVSGRLALLGREIKDVTTVLTRDSSVRHRLGGLGILTGEEAYTLGAVGPTLRASGVAVDMRQLGYAAFDRIAVTPVTETAGDCYARCLVRIREVLESIRIIQEAISGIPGGEVETKVRGRPEGEVFERTEQPRGEVVYHLRANGSKNLERFRVRTPTFANLAPLLAMLKGCQVADVPVLVLTIDPCISCAER